MLFPLGASEPEHTTERTTFTSLTSARADLVGYDILIIEYNAIQR